MAEDHSNTVFDPRVETPFTPPGWYMPLDDMVPADILKFHGPAVCDYVLASRARIERLKLYADYLQYWNLQRGKWD